jgi:Site-specific recombinase XerD
MKGKITKRTVDALDADPSSDLFLWDTELSGFGVRVKPSGARSFLIAYYAPGLHRTRRRLTLGAYGKLTVESARKKATTLLARVVNGEDPALEGSDERRAAKDETVAKLFATYLEEGVGRRKPRTLEFYESLGRLYILPALGKMPVAKVTHRDAAQLHSSLREKSVTANRVGRLIRSFFYWLNKRGNVKGENPAKNLDWFPEEARDRFLTVEELSRLGQALRVAETVGLPPAPKHKKKPGVKRAKNAGMFTSEIVPANPVAVSALRFLIFTGWREQEALTLKWSDVNLDTGIATLGDTKTGKSVRAITAPALALLDAQLRVDKSPYVFPGRDPKRPLRETQRLWHAVRCAAELDGLRLHDLRHSVASFAGAHGYSLFLIGKLLGHKTARSTERYAHITDDARKVMADNVGEGIRAALDSQPSARRDTSAINARG